MNNRAIFIQDHAPRTSRTVTLANGGVAYPYSDLAIGHIVGQYRTLRAAMTDDASDKDLWSIINLRHPVSRAHLGTVAILGALDDDQAKLFAVKTFGLEYENVEAAYDCIKAAPIALQRVLNREAAQGNFALTQEMLDRAARQISDRPVIWDSKNEANLVSHGGNASELLHEMVRYDSERQLTDSMNSADMACLLKEIGADDIDDEHNALIIEYGKFDTFMSRLTQAMSKASDKLKISDAQPTKPFKRNNVVNVAVQYSLSDGQSMTVVFHNPDSTPSKLQARDTLTSWKFMLNKRDITAAVSPENGKNVQLPVLAKRMMLLAEKNSAAFARANKNKAQKEADLVALEAENSKAQERIAGILAENESLQKEIDAVVVGKASEPAKTTGKLSSTQELIDVALSRKDGNKAFVELGKVTPEVAEKVKEAIGVDVTGWVHGLDEAGIRHVFEHHGNESTEQQRGQVAITQGDFDRLTDILSQPDTVTKGDADNTVMLTKKIGTEVFVVQELRIGRKKLVVKTMYKKPLSAPVAPVLPQSTAETSETFGKQASETIAQPAQEASQPAVEPKKAPPAYLPKKAAVPTGADDYIAEWGEFRFSSQEQAANYAKRLEAGEGGLWRAEEKDGGWRAHKVSSYDEPTFKEWGKALTTAYNNAKQAGNKELEDKWGNMYAEDLKEQYASPAEFLDKAEKELAVEPTGGGLEVVGVNFEWVRDGHDKLKFHLIDASGREYISIWKSGSKWATEAGEVFKTKAEAQEAGIKIAELRIRTEREEAESRKTALRRQPEPASNPDLDYLQSVIDGKVDFTDGETIENTLEEMAGRVGEDNPLFIKAVDAYAAYQVEQASKLGV